MNYEEGQIVSIRISTPSEIQSMNRNNVIHLDESVIKDAISDFINRDINLRYVTTTRPDSYDMRDNLSIDPTFIFGRVIPIDHNIAKVEIVNTLPLEGIDLNRYKLGYRAMYSPTSFRIITYDLIRNYNSEKE